MRSFNWLGNSASIFARDAFLIVMIVFASACHGNGAQKTSGSDSSGSRMEVRSANSDSTDASIFARRIADAKASHIDQLPIGDRIVEMGKLFLGTPYVAGTLDSLKDREQLVLDFRGLDCVTFYENSLALARVIRKYPNPTMDDYSKELEFLRYRDGVNRGYQSRLHYSIDYFRNNQKKGVLKIVTQEVGGAHAKLDTRTINFMSTHRSSYKQLDASDAIYDSIQQMENKINSQKDFYYIPKEEVAAVESNIKNGDILGITTNIPGLDCSHTGIAVKGADNRIHFMHASSLMHKVIISEESLAEYLTHSSHQTGIIVNRPIEVTN